MTKLQDIKEEFSKYFIIKDPWALEIVLATMLGNQVIERDPIWTIIVGPSSGGKTTLLAPCVGIPRTYFIDDLTEKTLLSGFKVKGKEASLLKQIGSGMMIFSDFTSILAKNPVSRGEILTQLKLVYDGKITKFTGTGGIPWEGKIGTLCASTPDIYTALENSRSMGERFLYYWLEQPTNEEIMAKQAEITISSKNITETMQFLYGEYYEAVKQYQEKHEINLTITPDHKKRIRAAAVFCVNGKATIHTDFKTGRPDAIPNIAGVGRDSKIFDTLLHTLQLMKCYELDNPDVTVTEEMVQIVEKCAYSSINRERRKILEILVNRGSPMTSSEIGAQEGLGLEKDSVNKYLAPLHAVGMIKKNAGAGAHKWVIVDEGIIEFVQRVSKTVIDPSPVSALEEVGEGELLDEYQNEVGLDAAQQAVWDSVPDHVAES